MEGNSNKFIKEDYFNLTEDESNRKVAAMNVMKESIKTTPKSPRAKKAKKHKLRYQRKVMLYGSVHQGGSKKSTLILCCKWSPKMPP